jgi:hypothetical protein
MRIHPYHPEWQNNRLTHILTHYNIKNKTILELAPYNGHIGNTLHQHGATIHQIEGRPENTQHIKETYPHLHITTANLDTPTWPWGHYDIIINFGLIYHLQHHHTPHLQNCIHHCKHLILETVIYDNPNNTIHYRQETGPDQSLTTTGGTPTTTYIENILKNQNTTYQRHDDPNLNGGPHHYNWKDNTLPHFDQCARRYWTIQTNNQ